MKKLIFLLVAFVSSSLVAQADDLYRVRVHSAGDARQLAATGAKPVARLVDAYLVLADAPTADQLSGSGLEYTPVATGIDLEQLALDGRLDRKNAKNFPIVFEEDNLRLYLVDFDELSELTPPPQLYPIQPGQIKIEYQESRPLDKIAPDDMIDLEYLISLVDQDSLESYSERLEAFYRRVAGTDSNYVSRDWLAAKLSSFDYDSVVIDSFVAELSGTPTECQNVIAYKIGTRYPNHQIIVGAHRDAVAGSPGADDNGSGTVGVLEIARVLKEIETDMTFIFILFDAEEFGLHGSYHYASEAKARGDSIVYMLNMDMIAHYQNTTEASLYHGSDLTFSYLWQDLADSLVGLSGILSGSSGGSDHYPFALNGYPVTFVAEKIFSTKYHSANDSTTYMDFAYMTKMVQASLTTAYVASATAGPLPILLFEYPIGTPEILYPDVQTTFEVLVSGAWDGVPVPGSAQLHYSIDGGAYVSVPMAELSSNHYEASLPAGDCGNRYQFYVSAEEGENGTFYDPDPQRPHTSVVATGANVVFEDDFELHLGWIVSGDALDGQWGRGTPAGGGTRGDPSTDYDGSGNCYLTDNVAGNSDVDDGTTFLDSPTFDLSMGDGEIRYARWYSNDVGNDPHNDLFIVSISNNNGANWTTVETVGPVEESSGGWYVHSFWAGDFITPTDQMKLRFAASDLNLGSVVEAAIDAVSVTTYDCATCDCGVWGDVTGDGQVNPVDAVFMVNFVYLDIDNRVQPPICPYEAGDVNCDGNVNPVDMVHYVNYVYLDITPFPCTNPCGL